jgi:hypothetical protein
MYSINSTVYVRAYCIQVLSVSTNSVLVIFSLRIILQKITVPWDAVLVHIYQYFRGTCCFHLQGGRVSCMRKINVYECREQRANHWEQCNLCQGRKDKPIRYRDRRMDTLAVDKSERVGGTEK